MFSGAFAYYLSEWIIRIFMLGVVTKRRQPASAMAWLLVIFFMPWPGLGLYWLIGENYLPRRRLKVGGKLVESFEILGQKFTGNVNIVRPTLDAPQMGAVKLAEKLGYLPILGGNHVEMIVDTDQVINRMIEDIDQATHHVHVLVYIYGNDATGRKVADALIRAVKRGVKCRVLVDAVGSRSMIKHLGPSLKSEGVEVHSALPVGLFGRRVARIDLRNHRKLAVIDGRLAYAGSQNIIDADYGTKDLAWHDLMVRLTGPAVLQLQAIFHSDWYFETDEIIEGPACFPEPAITGDVPAQTLPSGPNFTTENYQRLVVGVLHAAQRHVIMTTPYFIPDDAFIQAVQVAILRGVEVEFILSRRSDHAITGAASRAYYSDMLNLGAKIYLFDEGLLHAKTMSVDDAFAFIGSSNFDIRSFALNFEINLLFYGKQITDELRAHQNRYKNDSVILSRDEWERRPRFRRAFQTAAKLFSPLL